jgi:regulator of sigma E protease
MDTVLRWPAGLEWLAVIPMLSALVFVHELGHFAAAMLMKVRVEEFGFGYPPRMLVLWERKGVKYTLNWLPFGGFVRMAGEERGFEDPGSLASKKPRQRFLVFVSGPVMNFLFAVLIYIGMFSGGIPEPSGPVLVEAVAPGSPAAIADIHPGDVILRIGGRDVRSLTDVQQATRANLGQSTEVMLERGSERLTTQLTPRLTEDTPPDEGAMGVTITLSEIEAVGMRRVGFGRSIVLGIQRAFLLIGAMAEGLVRMVASLVTPSVPAPEGGVSGPVGIARLTGEIVRSGWLPFLDLTAFLSLNFALLNILPLPALDGGRLAFVVAEWVRRGKRVQPEHEAIVHLIGMVLLVGLMIVITYLDVTRWLQGGSVIPGG